MVSTLRITSVVVIFLAALVVGLVAGPSSLVPNLLVGFALRSDPEIERILSEPGVVDQWKLAHGDSDRSGQDTTSPLVRQAESFKNIIDPPPSPTPGIDAAKQSSATARGKPVTKPVPSSAKFDLVGTTVSADNCFAYIRLQDKTYQWARKGDEVGHLVIKEIKNGSIICWDGHADTEMFTESVPETASLLEVGGASVLQSSSQVGSLPPAEGRITGQPVPRPWISGEPAAQGGDQMSEQEREALGDVIVRQIRELQSDASTPDANLSPEDRDAAVERLIGEYKSSRVSPEEAEKVEDLGRELNESTEPSPADKLRDMRRKLNIPRSIRK